MTYTIAAFYRFLDLHDPAGLRDQLRAAFQGGDLRGTLLMANEGVNGTLAGSSETVDRLLGMLEDKVGLERFDVKFSSSQELPFQRLKFKVKAEIIAFRKASVDPTRPGFHVDADEWNALIAKEDVLLLDTRNTYETEIGSFRGAVAPAIDTFSDFVSYVRENLAGAKDRKVAMFCTGGIRCEKASAFMLQEGFSEVYHLRGGILKYLEEVPEAASEWKGKCYVFDRRVAVGHQDFEERGDLVGVPGREADSLRE